MHDCRSVCLSKNLRVSERKTKFINTLQTNKLNSKDLKTNQAIKMNLNIHHGEPPTSSILAEKTNQVHNVHHVASRSRAARMQGATSERAVHSMRQRPPTPTSRWQQEQERQIYPRNQQEASTSPSSELGKENVYSSAYMYM